jgi:hypothetical protein
VVNAQAEITIQIGKIAGSTVGEERRLGGILLQNNY